jgi:hypothetical protein
LTLIQQALDSDRLAEFLNIETATSTEISEMCVPSPQDDNNQQLKVSDSEVSLYRTKNTNKKEQQSKESHAASFSKVSKIEIDSTEHKSNLAKQSSDHAQKNKNTSNTKQNIGQDKVSVKVEQLVNLRLKEQIKHLDDAGISVNKTLVRLLKTHKPEEVEDAIALFKSRKREQHIPNPAGYFTKALKDNWADESINVDAPRA